MRNPRACSQVMSLGTRPAAAGTPGFEKIPTVLMSGIEQELLVPFSAQNRALDDVLFIAYPSHSRLDALASRAVQLRIAHDAALADLLSAHFKLWLDEYN